VWVLVALAGCGSSSNPSTTQQSASAVRTASTASSSVGATMACARVKAADARYRTAVEAQSLRLTNKRLAQRTIAGIAGLQTAVDGLASASGPSAAGPLGRLSEALTRQRGAVAAALRHDVAAAHKYSEGLNIALEQGRAALVKVCPGA
jgi:hypothetical protein